jgi:hypothetical protein
LYPPNLGVYTGVMAQRNTIPNIDRYEVRLTADGYRVWDKQDGVYIADAAGDDAFDDEAHAHDLAQEYRYS